MNQTIWRESIEKIIHIVILETIRDERKVLAMFSDLFPGANTECNGLKMMYASGAMKCLNEAFEKKTMVDLACARAVDALVNYSYMDKEIAKQLVSNVSLALRLKEEVIVRNEEKAEQKSSAAPAEIRAISQRAAETKMPRNVTMPKTTPVPVSAPKEPSAIGPVAQNSLGERYTKGDGVEKNYKKEVECFKNAAEQGYARAQYNLGYCYEHALGVVANYFQAEKWYVKAADQGEKVAVTALENMYKQGKINKQRYKNIIEKYL